MRIESLNFHPQLIPIVVQWRWEEWGHHDPGGSSAAWQEELTHHLSHDEIPQTLIAFWGSQPVGVASLIQNDMETRKDLSPWLAGLYVLPEFRSRGIASSLIREIEHNALALGFEEIYLYTNGAEGLYAKLSWQEIDREVYRGREVVIMRKSLGSWRIQKM